MALPNGVSILPEGRLQFVTQRGYFAPPYVSCMFAALSSVLFWMGYDQPIPRAEEATPPENFVWTMHKASGASLTSGSSIAHTKNALNKLLPDADVMFAVATPDEVIKLLENDAAVRVTAKCSKLPKHLKRWVGKYEGGHAFAIIGTRVHNGEREVFWLDPMGRPAIYDGIWIKWSDVSSILSGTNGIVITFGYKNAAITPPDPVEPEEEEMPLTQVVELQRGSIPAGTPILHPVTHKVLFTSKGNESSKLMGVTSDGKFRGIMVVSKRIEGNGWKVAHVAADKVQNVRVEDPSVQLQADLIAANEKIGGLEERLDLDVADAKEIIARNE